MLRGLTQRTPPLEPASPPSLHASTPLGGARGSNAELLLLLAILAFSTLLRIELIRERSLWVDEALSLDMASLGPWSILATSARSEPHPPGYYVVLWAWTRLFGLEVLPARALSVLFGLGVVAGTWLLGRCLGGKPVGILAALLVATNPFQIYAANEIRMYTLLGVAGLAATFCAWRAAEGHGNLWWLAYGACAAAVGYVSYYGFLLLGAHLAWLLPRWKDPDTRHGLLLASLAGLLCYGPWLPSLPGSITSNPVPWRPSLTVRQVSDLLATQAFGGHVGGTAGYLYWVAHTPPARGFALAVPFFVLATLGFRRLPRQTFFLLACSWIIPLAVVLVASLLLGRLAAYEYHLTYLQPYLAVLMAAGATALSDLARPRWRLTVLLAVAAALLAFSGVAVDRMYAGRQSYRFDRAARFLQSVREPGDITLYYVDNGYRVLRWYGAAGQAFIRVHPDPRRWSRQAALPLLKKAVGALKPTHRKVWVVLTLPYPDGSPQDLFRLLEDRGYRRSLGADFAGVAVIGFWKANSKPR